MILCPVIDAKERGRKGFVEIFYFWNIHPGTGIGDRRRRRVDHVGRKKNLKLVIQESDGRICPFKLSLYNSSRLWVF